MAVAMREVRDDLLAANPHLSLYCDPVEDAIVVALDGCVHRVLTRRDVDDGDCARKLSDRIRFLTGAD